MPRVIWPTRPDENTRWPYFDDEWIRSLAPMTDAELEQALLPELGLPNENDTGGDLWHYHFCGFRQSLLPEHQHRFRPVTHRVAAWMKLPATQAKIKNKLGLFCQLPPGRALVAGDWDGPTSLDPDAATGAILDSCYECLECMQQYNLLPAGNTGQLEYNSVGFTLVSIALHELYRNKNLNGNIAEPSDAQGLLNILTRRMTAPGILPFEPHVIGRTNAVSIFQLALDLESWLPAIESLVDWHERTSTEMPCPTVFAELDFRARWQLCKVSNLRVLQWARQHSVEISLGENPRAMPPTNAMVETCWQAVAHNPAGNEILDELLKTAGAQTNHMCGRTGRNGVSEAILSGRPDIVRWFLDDDDLGYRQNLHFRVRNQSVPLVGPSLLQSSMDYSMYTWDATTPACLYMMMKYEPTIRYMETQRGGLAAAQATVARHVLLALDGPIEEYDEKGLSGQISIAERDRNVARLRELALLKWYAALDGAGPEWKDTDCGRAMRTSSRREDRFMQRHLDEDYPRFPVERATGLLS